MPLGAITDDMCSATVCFLPLRQGVFVLDQIIHDTMSVFPKNLSDKEKAPVISGASSWRRLHLVRK